jgi:hypothetical protein
MKSKRPTPDARPAWRVGYVNINGLADDKWECLTKLLHSTFDFLFLAETWYVGHRRRVRDRRLVASTPFPLAPLAKGRRGGGIYLLATESARSMIVGDPQVTDLTIRLEVAGMSIAAVYLPPALSAHEVQSTLDSLTGTSIILGDVNARFPWLTSQSGSPGPPDRVAAFRSFTRMGGYTALQPGERHVGLPKAIVEQNLTVDHCFVRAIDSSAQLTLLNNTSLGLRTDHKYTMHLRISTGQGCCGEAEPSHTSRYRIGLLTQQQTKMDVCSRFDVEMKNHPTVEDTDDPDRLHAILVHILQSVCDKVLGRRPDRLARRKPPPGPSPRSPDAAVSVLLYKSAASDSRENGVVMPSPEGRRRGMDARTEIAAALSKRYTTEEAFVDGHSSDASSTTETLPPFSEDDVKKEITAQDASKACGGDGIHMRLLQALLPSSFPRLLCRLFNLCLRAGTTPRAWNLTDIHLLTKDIDKPRDVNNVRPITLIGMHRKVFERLLLTHHFDRAGWAKLHPTQAGFRGDCSTLTNAAMVHHLLASRSIKYAAFVDLEKAFDMVDHSRLAALLLDRGCPRPIYRIICSLTFEGVQSRVLVNGKPSPPFRRTRGALQGSPISPDLFNIYIDDLVYRLNAFADATPRSLFYADDGVLLANDLATIQHLADILTRWSAEAKIGVNVKKCGILCARRSSDSVDILIDGKPIPVVASYTYLGFPVKARGIDFEEHLRNRLSHANGRASFLRLHSDDWGPAHRLRVYRQYLAPMFEYGAPLAWAWATQSPCNMLAFKQATDGWKDLVSWVVTCDRDSCGVAANLCGLVEPTVRFGHLHTAFQRLLAQSQPDNPLKLAGSRLLQNDSSNGAFIVKLRSDQDWKSFKSKGNDKPTLRLALRRFLQKRKEASILKDARSRHLTSITAGSRSMHTLHMADSALLSPIQYQQAILKYRMGTFMFGTMCACDPHRRFGRGHEACPHLPQLIRLSKMERRQKKMMIRTLFLDRSRRFTDVDFLINKQCFHRVGRYLSAIRNALKKIHHQRMLTAEETSHLDIASFATGL